MVMVSAIPLTKAVQGENNVTKNATHEKPTNNQISPSSTTSSPTSSVVNIKNASYLKLFKLIEEEQNDAAIQFVTQKPAEASKWIVRRDERGTIGWRVLPLHMACKTYNPTNQSSLVSALLQAYPSAARAKDHDGRLPLHHACLYGATAEIVKMLLVAFPEGTDVADGYGRKPRHCIEKSTAENRRLIEEDMARGISYWQCKKKKNKKQQPQHQKGEEPPTEAAETETEPESTPELEPEAKIKPDETTLESNDDRDDGASNASAKNRQPSLEGRDDKIPAQNNDNLSPTCPPKNDSTVSNHANKNPTEPTTSTTKIKTKTKEVSRSSQPESSHQNTTMETKVMLLTQKLTSLSLAKKQLDATSMELKQALDRSNTERALLEEKFQAAIAQSIQQDQDMEDLAASEQALRQEGEKLWNQMKKVEATLARQEKQLLAVTSERDVLQEQLQNMTMEKSRFEEKCKKLSDKLTEAQAEAENIRALTQKEHAELMKNYQTIRSILAEKEKKEIMECKLQKSTATIAQLRGKVEASYVESQSRVATLKNKLVRLEKEQSMHDARHEKEKSQLKEQVARLEQSVLKLSAELEKNSCNQDAGWGDECKPGTHDFEVRLRELAEQHALRTIENLASGRKETTA